MGATQPPRLPAARLAAPAHGRGSKAAPPRAEGAGRTTTSTLGPLETVERGYTDVVARLQSLGAAVEVAPS